MTIIDRFEAMLAAGRDNPLLRFSLGSEYLKNNELARAAEHFRAAVAQDAHYTAAWKLLGKCLVQSDDQAGAIEAFGRGIAVAEQRGDKQAAKEMRIFLRRLQPPD
ncbi:MAG TPA: hypothetical protein PLI90_10955 [Rhodocyclaceae bacterium]|nr:hypothetical protein [Rhodocyclaceae bacterium]